MIGLTSRTTSPSSVVRAQHPVRGGVVGTEGQQLLVLGVRDVLELDRVLLLAVGDAAGPLGGVG